MTTGVKDFAGNTTNKLSQEKYQAGTYAVGLQCPGANNIMKGK